MAEPVLFPFRVNWDAGYRVSYDLLTEILTSDNGREQRRALRQTPRKTVEFEIQVYEQEQVQARRFFERHLNATLVMPEHVRKITPLAAVGVNATSFPIAETPRWLVAGVTLLFSNAATGAFELVVVESVASNEVVITDGFTTAWPIDAAVHYALQGRLAGEAKRELVTSALASAMITFNVDPGSEVYGAGASGTVTDGREVLPFKPNWAGGLQIADNWETNLIDFGYGRTTYYEHIEFPHHINSAEYLFFSADETESMLQFYLRQEGALGEFLEMGHELELEMVGGIAAGATYIDVADASILGEDGDSLFHKMIGIRKSDGSVIARTVDSLEAGDGFTQIKITSPITESLSGVDVSRISWLLNSRFATDVLQIEWITSEVAQTKIATRTLKSANDAADTVWYQDTPPSGAQTLPGQLWISNIGGVRRERIRSGDGLFIDGVEVTFRGQSVTIPW